MTLRSISWILTTGLAAGFALGACDLPQKDLGNETADGGNSDDGGMCEDGDTKLADDGCNTCECRDGDWLCTEEGCGDGSQSGTSTTGADDGFPPCEPGDQMPDPDGCNTCVCDENGDWACTEIACPETESDSETGEPMGDPFANNGVTEMCAPDVPFDDAVVTAAAINGDDLNATIAYGGGCMEHLFGICWDSSFAESEPVQVWLELAHDGMNDPCDAFPSEERTFDLTPLAEAYADAYGQGGSNTIEIHFADWTQTLTYTF